MIIILFWRLHMKPFSRILLACTFLAPLTNSFAQNSSGETRLTTLQQEATKQDQSILTIAQDLKRLDEKIEADIKKILDTITKYKDSNDSGYRVLRNKERLIGGLNKSIDFYTEHREAVTKELLNNRFFEAEHLKKLANYLDKKITLRVKQILDVTKSLEQYKEIYDSHRYSGNDKSKVRRAEKEKSSVIKDFEKTRKELMVEQEKLQRTYDNPSAKISHETISDELTAIYKKIELIDYSIEDVLNGGKDAKRLSDDSAKVIERQIRDRASSIKSTFTTYSRGFDNLLRQLRKRHTQQDSIDRQEALIKRQQQQ